MRKKSRDFFWYSPILNAQLKALSADLLVEARDEADVIKTAAACARHRVPLTVRGGGTGNYGQCVPLEGGVVLDVSGLDRVIWHRGDLVRAEAGIRLNKLDDVLRPSGCEIRMHPSTKRTSSLGGFVAGGSGGIGSVTYGGLRDPGDDAKAKQGDGAIHSGLIPACRIVRAHFAISLTISFSSSTGVETRTSDPSPARRLFTSGDWKCRAISWLRRLTISPLVPAGATSE